jgi:hypothetical protein
MARPLLHIGDRGDAVRELQALLGVATDGIFGSDVRDAVRDVQDRAGLARDGLVGPATWRALAGDDGAIEPDGASPMQRGGVPFAEPTGRFWPVQTLLPSKYEVAYRGEDRVYRGRAGRAFWARRGVSSKNGLRRRHIGIDLWADEGDVVIAPEDGTITRARAYYRGTDALLLQTDGGIVLGLCEVRARSWEAFGLEAGSRVAGGEPVAVVGKMRVSSMLHVVTYAQGTTKHLHAYDGAAVNPALLDPSKYLLALVR